MIFLQGLSGSASRVLCPTEYEIVHGHLVWYARHDLGAKWGSLLSDLAVSVSCVQYKEGQDLSYSRPSLDVPVTERLAADQFNAHEAEFMTVLETNAITITL